MALSANSSSGKSAASQASSASASTWPSAGPSAIPRARKSAAFSGNLGALQRSGRVASSRHGAGSEPPPAMAHRIQRPGFAVGKLQAHRKPPRVLGDGDRQRAEAANRVSFESKRALRGNHGGKRPGIGDAAENRQQQS